MKVEEMAASLAAWFDARTSSTGHEVRGLTRLSGGASRETFSLDVVGPAADGAPDAEARPLILQRVRSGAVGTTSSMEGEGALLVAAAAAGVPVAGVVGASDDPAIVGAPFVLMERLAGETLARRILRDDEYAKARPALVGQCARALAGIHALPLDAGPHLRADDPIGSMRGLLDMLGEPHPAFELALRWLDAHRPASTRTTVVHGDFRLGNLIVDADGLVAVLDWELAHVGDPVEDLGWLCVRAWRFGSPHPVAGVGSYEELLAAYAEASGIEVDPEALRWWEVLGTLKWGVICILQASGHLSGASRSVELAAIGRRTVENEYDVLRLLGAEGPAPSTEVDGYDTGPHDAPTAPQLVEAVREFLERDVMGATSGRVQFHARVAANVLATVERELHLGPAIAERHRAQLARLGFPDDAALAAAIRTGELDPRFDELRDEVYRTVVDKLSVANPGYA